ncbi:MAG: type phosphodiesterase/nucleotide pyrophosphatase [Phycisphaerales bacterium]|nr:type phosphodiesterase/nucleotide pyrophosphatase [Phycisphaerales bacterium]
MLIRTPSLAVAMILAFLLCALCVVATRADSTREATTQSTTQPTPPRPAKPATRPVRQINRVLLISVDGLRPDLLARAYAPNVRGLMNAGSFTLWARTTAAAVTLPSHVSMLTGVTPAKHQIAWNTDLPLAKPVYPKGRTLFDIAKSYGYSTAMVAGKSKFEIFERPNSIDWCWVSPKEASPTTKPSKKFSGMPEGPLSTPADEEWPDDSTKAKKEKLSDAIVAEQAVQIIHDHRPDVLFVHFPHVDNVGHMSGWGTPEQIDAVEEADAAVGSVLRAISDAGLMESTLIILTADHGGAGRGHGADDPRSRHIPWIAAGPGIRRNFDLTRYPELTLNTEDTFATACYFLGMTPSSRIDGKPVREILRLDELLQAGR